MRQKVLLCTAVSVGLLIAYVDTRPHWDDTAITVVAILTTSVVFGFLGPKRPWLWALAIGVWVPVFEIMPSLNPAPLVALLVAFAGAYAGMGIRKTLG